ncbi:MAG: hypothetical protein P8046_10910 [Anaerolineales bacterium]
MTELTIFTAPKPFTDPHIAAIQRNAIQSWVHLGGGVQVILMGTDTGVDDLAAELGLLHIPDVATNEKGVPYIGDMFRLAREHSDAPVLAIVNADILLFPDFLLAARQAHKQWKEFVLVGQRWDLDVTGEIEFSAGWQERLLADAHSRGRLHNPAGSDYFIFSRPVYQQVPDFTIGRAGWDNWMIYHARRKAWKVLDATADITIIHQNHDYSHLPDGKIHYRLPESEENVALGGGVHHMDNLIDLDGIMIDGQAQPKPLTWFRLVRKTERLLQPKSQAGKVRTRLYTIVKRYRKRL